jgi:hypothetical protein
LLSLLSTGRIAIEQPSSAFKEAALIVIRDATSKANPLPSHLKAVEEALTSHRPGGRLINPKVLDALQKRFGYDFGRYVHDEVAPALVKREFLIRHDGRWLGVFPKISYERTAAGAAITAPLERLVVAVNHVPSLIERDPDAAIKLAMEAGALLIMSPPARRQLPVLRKLLKERGDGHASTMPGISDDKGNGGGTFLDFAGIDLSLGAETLLASIDAVGEFTSSGDSGSSDGGDGGGGGD